MSQPLDYESKPPPVPRQRPPRARSLLSVALWLTTLSSTLLVPAMISVLATARHFGVRRSVPNGLGNLVTVGYCILCLSALGYAVASVRSADDRTVGSILLAVLCMLAAIACAVGFLVLVDLLLGPPVG